MKLIGAGLPRTATTTQMIALEMLGFPCYHMRDMMADPATSVPQYRAALNGNADWDEIFEGKESTVDWPAAYHWRELSEVYPDAKVLLSVRDAESWVRSMENTITQVFMGDTLMYHLARAQYHVDPLYAAWIDLLTEMNWGDERGAFAGTNGEPAADGRCDGALESDGHRHGARGSAARLASEGRLGAALRAARRARSRRDRSRTSTTPRTSRRTSSWLPPSTRSTLGGSRTARLEDPADEASGWAGRRFRLALSDRGAGGG